MKTLKIQNRSGSPLFFVYVTISKCTCAVCMEWMQCETLDVYDWPGCTYGYLSVDGFQVRQDRFCPHWDCVGACFFGQLPQPVRKEMLFDFQENGNYSIGDGKATLDFTAGTPVQKVQQPRGDVRAGRAKGEIDWGVVATKCVTSLVIPGVASLFSSS